MILRDQVIREKTVHHEQEVDSNMSKVRSNKQFSSIQWKWIYWGLWTNRPWRIVTFFLLIFSWYKTFQTSYWDLKSTHWFIYFSGKFYSILCTAVTLFQCLWFFFREASVYLILITIILFLIHFIHFILLHWILGYIKNFVMCSEIWILWYCTQSFPFQNMFSCSYVCILHMKFWNIFRVC